LAELRILFRFTAAKSIAPKISSSCVSSITKLSTKVENLVPHREKSSALGTHYITRFRSKCCRQHLGRECLLFTGVTN
jgi:hypothetical protein